MVFPTSTWPHTEPHSVDALVLGPGAWGRASFFAFSPSAAVLPRIYYPDYPLGTGMDVNVSDFNGLLVTTPVLVQRLDQLELEPEEPSGVTPIDPDEHFIQMPLAVPKELEPGESSGDDLNSDQRLEFTLRLTDATSAIPALRVASSSTSCGPGRSAETSCVSITSTNSSESVSPKTFLKAALCSSSSAGARTTSLCLLGFFTRGGAFFPTRCVGGLFGRVDCHHYLQTPTFSRARAGQLHLPAEQRDVLRYAWVLASELCSLRRNEQIVLVADYDCERAMSARSSQMEQFPFTQALVVRTSWLE